MARQIIRFNTSSGHRSTSSKGSLVAHITDDNLKLQWKAVVSGTFIQAGPDTLETNLTLALYTPDQNPFAEGAMPIMFIPGVMDTLQRVPIVPAYVPPAEP